MENPTKEYLFSLELVTTVMRKYRSNWETRFPHDHGKGLFTSKIKDAILSILERRDIELFFLFSAEFASKGVTLETFLEICHQMMSDFTSESFNAKEFVWYGIVLAVYAVMAEARGVKNAPFLSIPAIHEGFKHYRHKGEFTDSSWVDLEQAAIEIAQETS